MLVINKHKYLTALVLIVSFLFSSFSSLTSAEETNSYVLQHNTVINNNGIWGTNSDIVNEHLLRYNCYAYAINRVEIYPFYDLYYNMNIGTRYQYQPGNMCRESYSITDGMDVYDLAMLVREDLVNLGYDTNSIYVSASIPDTSNWNSNMELICVRTGYHYDNNHPVPFDYHFMKYDPLTDAWYHTVGQSVIMKYNYTPWHNNHIWIGESYYQGVSKLTGYTYNSSIIYITYPKLQLDISYGIVDKESVLKSNRDVIYEILVPETGMYSFEISSECQEANYAYEIYSYNMYNGDYQSIKVGMGNSSMESNESIQLVAPDDFNDQYQIEKNYVRLYFDRSISEESSINVSIEHPHSFTHHYEQCSNSQHSAYCECSMYELQAHNFNQFSNITSTHHTTLCICGAVGETKPHYEAYGEYYTKDWHYVYCDCGYLIRTDTHSMVPGWKLGTSRCTVCGYIRNNSGLIEVIKGIEDEAETE